MGEEIGNMWSRIRFRIAQFFCKSSVIWGDATTKFRTVYYFDNSMMVEIDRKSGSPLVLYIDGQHVAKIVKWLNEMHEESLNGSGKSRPTSGNKVIKFPGKLPLSHTPPSPDRNPPSPAG